MAESKKPIPSALAMAKRSTDLTLVFTAEALQAMRSDWSRADAERFLRQHRDVIAHVLITAGIWALKTALDQNEIGGPKAN